MKENRIICLDFDDCILPSNNNYFGYTDDNMRIAEINLQRIKMICEKYGAKIFITSSWYTLLKFKSRGKFKNITLNVKSDDYHCIDADTHLFVGLLQKYIGKYIVSLSEGNRDKDIEKLKQDPLNKIVVIDDMDLSEHSSDKCLFLYTNGLITNQMGYFIDKFFEPERYQL